MSVEKDIRICWEEMRKGDKQALFTLYNAMYFHLIRFGLKMGIDDDLVKDCINQMFLNLWEKRTRLNTVENVRPYLFTTLRHIILDELSHLNKIGAAIEKKLYEDEQDELPYEEIIIRMQQDDELKRKLQQAIEKLTPRQIELIRLKFFEGLTYEQIAGRTSQSVKTAYNTIYDAIKMLRKLLK